MLNRGVTPTDTGGNCRTLSKAAPAGPKSWCEQAAGAVVHGASTWAVDR